MHVTLRAEIAIIFGPNVVRGVSQPYRNQTFQFYSFQYALSSCCVLFASPCLVLKLVYNGNCLFLTDSAFSTLCPHKVENGESH